MKIKILFILTFLFITTNVFSTVNPNYTYVIKGVWCNNTFKGRLFKVSQTFQTLSSIDDLNSWEISIYDKTSNTKKNIFIDKSNGVISFNNLNLDSNKEYYFSFKNSSDYGLKDHIFLSDILNSNSIWSDAFKTLKYDISLENTGKKSLNISIQGVSYMDFLFDVYIDNESSSRLNSKYKFYVTSASTYTIDITNLTGCHKVRFVSRDCPSNFYEEMVNFSTNSQVSLDGNSLDYINGCLQYLVTNENSVVNGMPYKVYVDGKLVNQSGQNSNLNYLSTPIPLSNVPNNPGTGTTIIISGVSTLICSNIPCGIHDVKVVFGCNEYIMVNKINIQPKEITNIDASLSYQLVSNDGSNKTYNIVLNKNTTNFTGFTGSLTIDQITVPITGSVLNGGVLASVIISCGSHVISLNLENQCSFIKLPITFSEPCEPCCTTFKPEPGKRYWISGWVSELQPNQIVNYENAKLQVQFLNNGTLISSVIFAPQGDIIENWQRIIGDFVVPINSTEISINLYNENGKVDALFDDIRIHPFNGSFKSYVYDPLTLKLTSELDDNNYATFYEYDKEGKLIRIKKETERGIMTIQESRSSNPIK